MHIDVATIETFLFANGLDKIEMVRIDGGQYTFKITGRTGKTYHGDRWRDFRSAVDRDITEVREVWGWVQDAKESGFGLPD